MLIFAVTIRALDFQHWITDKTLFEQAVLSVIMQEVPEVDEHALIVLLVRPENQEVLEHLNNTHTFQNALRILYDDPILNAHLCYLSSEPWGWHDELCYFSENGVHTSFSGSETIFAYDSIVLFEFVGNRQTVLLHYLPSDIDFDGTIAKYDPVPLINSNAPLPERYFTMMNPQTLIPR